MWILITLLMFIQNVNSTFQDAAMRVSVKLMSRIPNETYNNFVVIRDDFDVDDQEVFDVVDFISNKIPTSIQILRFK